MKILIRLMMLGYYPFLAAVFVSAFGLFVYSLMQFIAFDRFASLPYGLAAGVLLLSFAQFAFILPDLLYRVPEEDPFEVRLPAQKIAGLRRLAWDIARERGLPPPDDLRLHGETIACVYEDKGGLRILVVGCIAVAALSQQALAGIIAHELGHFAAGDTALSRSGHSVLRTMGRFEGRVHYDWLCWLNPVVLTLRTYHALFLIFYFAQSRQAEYAADRHEAELVGKQVAAATLILFEVLPRLPWTRLSSVARGYAMAMERGEDIFTEQVRRARATDPGELQDACRKALKQKTGYFDSHPCLKDRLKAIGVSSKKAGQLALDLFTEGEPASGLFPNWPSIQKEFSDDLMLIYREMHEARQEIMQIFMRRR
jgi:Zn-dependent protease with chaperone function